MKRVVKTAIASGLLIFASACKNRITFDSSGSFEAEEVIISSEANGVIKQFIIEEGETLEADLVIGYIDSTQLYLKKKQLETQISALLTKKPDIPVQMASLLVQVKAAETELARAGNLLRSGAATQKLFDEISAQVEVLRKQVDAQRSSLEKTDEGITREAMALKVQIELLDDQLDKCRIINPVNGTVLVKYAEANEMTASGKPLYKIADLTTLIIRAYITGNQLPQVKLNQKVKVLTDDGNGGFRETEGVITWINDKAEFTPKTIQTKDERANLVYAIKVKVANDGHYKIGMYLVAVLGIGLLISTYSNTQQQAMSLMFFFIMIFILMSGMFTPVDSMPEWAKWITRVNPVT